MCKIDQATRDNWCQSLIKNNIDINFSVGNKVNIKYIHKNICITNNGIITRIYGKKYLKFAEILIKESGRIILPLFYEGVEIKKISNSNKKIRRKRLSYLYNTYKS